MAQNPFYVQPLGGFDIGRGLQGLQQNIEAKQERDRIEQEQIAQQERQNMAQSEMMRVLDSGSPREMAGFLSQYPEMGDVFKQAYGFTAPQTEGIVKDFGARILATEDPEKAKTALSEMIMAYRDAGVTAPTNTVAALQELEAGEEGALDRIKMITMALNPDLREGFMEQQDKASTPEEQFSNIKDLRDAVRKADPDYIKIEDAYARIQASSENPSAAGDLALIFNYMKLLDPGSTVREGEFANAQNAGGVDDVIRSAYNRVISGERLTTDQRSDFSNRAGKLFSKAKDLNQKRTGKIRQQAQELGLPEELIFSEQLEVDQPTAPTAAIEFLRANPDKIDDFVSKYGYRPEGF